MREIRLSGSEGGGALTGSPYPYPPIIVVGHFLASALSLVLQEQLDCQHRTRHCDPDAEDWPHLGQVSGG